MKEKNGEHPFGDAGQAILIVIFLIVWTGDSFFLHRSVALRASIPLFIRLIVFGLTFILAMILLKSSHAIAHQENRPDYVITTGAFGYVRHPLYLSPMLVFLGMTIWTCSLASLALLVIMFIFYNYIAGYEEKLLEKKHGEAYRVYRKTTGRWLPKIKFRRQTS